ncbi:MAG: nucleotide exchange factor GrpE [Bacteroidales bacterium]|nr:nucleotide exchange factor GrpE [Bacteroidales bacterium]
MTDKSKPTMEDKNGVIKNKEKQDHTKINETEKKNRAKKASAKQSKKAVEQTKKTDKTRETAAEEKIAEFQNKYIRLSADFDNYRKRTLNEKIELIKSANAEILLNLLPVMDDIERALKSMEDTKGCKAMKDGIDLIYNKFSEFLKSSGVKEIDAMHKKFDTDIHEAVTKIPAPEKKLKGKVLDVIQKGYFLNGKIIRYPKVIIGD